MGLFKVGERGDTLIEVTIALSILTFVLTISSVTAARALRLGVTAKERTIVSNLAQQQMEALRALRDNHSWAEFLNGSGSNTGVLNTGATSGCHVATKCFYMKQDATGEYVPQDGPTNGSVPTSYIEIEAIPVAGAPPESVNFIAHYGFENIGGGPDNVGHIQTMLTNLQFAQAAPCSASPKKDVVLTLDASSSMGGVWQTMRREDKLKAVVNAFIDNTSLSPSGNHESIIDFNLNPTLLSDFSGDPLALKAAMGGYILADWTHFTSALQLTDATFGDGAARTGVPQVLVFVTDGLVDFGDTPAAATAAAAVLKSKGVQIYTIGILDPTDPSYSKSSNLLAAMSGNGGYFTDAAQESDLDTIMSTIAAGITSGC